MPLWYSLIIIPLNFQAFTYIYSHLQWIQKLTGLNLPSCWWLKDLKGHERTSNNMPATEIMTILKYFIIEMYFIFSLNKAKFDFLEKKYFIRSKLNKCAWSSLIKTANDQKYEDIELIINILSFYSYSFISSQSKVLTLIVDIKSTYVLTLQING